MTGSILPRTQAWRKAGAVQFEAPHHVHELPTDVADHCRHLLRGFGLVFGAIDLILTPRGTYVFLELNPNGEWDWIEALTGMPIAKTLTDALTTARH